MRPLAGGVLLCALVVPPSLHAHQECCAPVKVAEMLWDVESVGYGVIVMAGWLATDAIGGVYARWTPIAETPRLAVSWDDGTTWQPPIDRLAGNSNYYLNAVDASGTLVVAYVQRTDLVARVSHDQARSFSNARRLASVSSIGIATIAVAAPSTAVIAWGQSNWPTPEPTDGAWAVVSTDHGNTWSAPARVSDGTGTLSGIVRGLAAAASSDGSVTLAWMDDRDAGSGVWSSRSEDGGRNWSANVLVEPRAGGWVPVRLILGSSGGTHQHAVVVSDGSGYRVRVHASPDAGATWLDSGLVLPVSDVWEGFSAFADDGGRVGIATLGGTGEWRLTVSEAHGMPGTWRTGSGQWGLAGRGVHSPGTGEWSDGSVAVVHDDYRDNFPCAQAGATCESIYVDRSCDGGDAWLETDIRVDDDTYPSFPHSEEPLVASSPAGRVHVLWSDAGRPDSSLSQIHHAALELPDVPDLDVSASASARSACEASSYRIEARVLAPGPCIAPTYEWYQDGVPVPGATASVLDVSPATTPGEHVFWFRLACNPRLACGELSPPLVVRVEGPLGDPVVSLGEDPSAGCDGSRYRMAVTHALSTCANVTHQWFEDGVPIPGATASTHDVPPDHAPGRFRFHAEVRCEDAPPCNMPSDGLEVDVERPSGAVLGGELQGLLFVRKAPGTITLAWTDGDVAAASYHAYAGPIGTWYGHGSLACGIVRAGGPGAPTETMTAMPPSDTYYLVAPADCGSEGTLGASSLGAARPQAAVGDACGPLP
jgi:hypothetical protein